VSNCCPIYSDVVVITKVQELLSGELGVIVGDDSIRDPKAEDNVFGKAYRLFGANFGHELSLNPLSELVGYDKQVDEAPERFFEECNTLVTPGLTVVTPGSSLES
jgi:hypothetical protein